MSVVLKGKEDVRLYETICKALNRNNGLSKYVPADLQQAQKAINICRKLDKLQHTNEKHSSQDAETLRMAEAMDIPVPDDMLNGQTAVSKRDLKMKTARLRGELDDCLL